MAFTRVTISADVGGKPGQVPGPAGPAHFPSAPFDPGAFHSPMDVPHSSQKIPNHREDVTKVQRLINAVYRPDWPIETDGFCDGWLITTITQIQAAFGQIPDGVISPGGLTLRVLNDLATPARIIRTAIGHFERGCYDIRYSWPYDRATLPDGYRLLLRAGELSPAVQVGQAVPDTDRERALDVTREDRGNLLTQHNIVDFMDRLGKLNKWAESVPLYLLLVRNDRLVWKSASRQFNTPVMPYSGRMTPQAFAADNSLPKMIYVGTGKKGEPFIGRRLWQIGDKYYFRYGSKITVKNEFRGMDCTNFIGSLYQLPTNWAGTGNPYWSSPKMAQALDAKAFRWSETEGEGDDAETWEISTTGTGAAIKRFFNSTNPGTADPQRVGTYLLWTSGHLMIIVRKTVYEWSPPFKSNGWKSEPIATRVTDTDTYNIRILPNRLWF